jgi:hypothetical protein
MRTIRASELGAYLYCQRAWWYQKNGETPENQAEIHAGVDLHEKHARSVLASGCIRSLAYLLLVGALLLAVAEIVRRMMA